MRKKRINKESFETLRDALDEIQRLEKDGWWVTEGHWWGWIMVQV